MLVPSYIVKHTNGIYYFRYVIPKPRIHSFPRNKREIRRSLHTRHRNTALQRAKIYWVTLMTETDIDSYEYQLNEWEKKIRHGLKVLDELERYDANYENANSSDACYDSTLKDEYMAHLSDYDIECLELATKERHNNLQQVQTAPQQLPNSPTSLHTKFEEYIAEKGHIRDKTIRAYRSCFKQFQKLTGANTTNDLSVQVIRQYKIDLTNLPHKLPPSATPQTIKKLIAAGTGKTISLHTVNMHTQSISSFLKWLFIQQYVDQDFSNLMISIKNTAKKKASQDRAVFTSEDLTKLFATHEYSATGFRGYSFRYWLPLLALYTGARLNELCQLHISDVSIVDNIYILDINEDGSKKVKTSSSIRQIPLHKQIIALGFDDYLQHVIRLKQQQLFPALTPNKDLDYSRKVSRFFNESFKQRQGFMVYAGIKKHTNQGTKVFHSFRHTFINQWKQQGLDANLIKQLVGHSSNDITYDRYGKAYDIKLASKELNKIDFGINKLPIKWESRMY